MKVSICITTYESNGKGKEFITRNLIHCIEQTYRPLEIVISDHSIDNNIKDVIESFSHPEIEIKYLRYEEKRGFPCANWNNAFKFSSGDYIKILAMDDYLAYPDSIKDSMNFVNTNTEKWFVSHRIDENNGIRTKKEAFWNSNILRINSLSGPSCSIMSRNVYEEIKLDDDIIWFLDIDWYYRLYAKYGKPGIIPLYTWVNSQHDGQLSHTAILRESYEVGIIAKKYNGFPLSP